MTGSYEAEFPYVSPCGREVNYIRCDDLPIVFSQLLTPGGQPVQDIGSYGSSKESDVPTTRVSSSGEGAASCGGSERHSAARYVTNCTEKQRAATSYGSSPTGRQDAASHVSERSVTGCVSEGRGGGDSVSGSGVSVLSEEKQDRGGWSYKSAAQSETTEEVREMERNSSTSATSQAPKILQTPVHPDMTTIQPAGGSPALLAYGGTLTLTVPFQPHKLCMLPGTGRVYHPGPEQLGSVGLVKSSLAIEFSRFFTYEEGGGDEDGGGHPTGFRWRGREWELDGAVLEQLQSIHSTTSTAAGAGRSR